MKVCWHCRGKTKITYGNGVCIDCFSFLSHASYVHEEMMQEFEEGELTEEAFEKEYQIRLKLYDSKN